MERTPTFGRVALPILAAICAAALAGGAQPGRAAGASDRLPDLVADPPANPKLDYHTYAADNSHDLLLRFDGFVRNVGAGALHVEGSRPNSDNGTPMTARQRVFRSDGSWHDDAMPGAQLFFSNADGHHHWHLQDVARYSLWNYARTAEVAPAMKVGFCLEDSQHVESFGPSVKAYRIPDTFCDKNHPEITSETEGVSSGWRDIYDRDLALQWVVISDVQPGRYWLREDIDPVGIVHESDEDNSPGWSESAVTVPGYVAKPISRPAGAYGKPQQIELDASTFGDPGARRFQVLTPPAHGRLDVGAGTAFGDATVVYTPDSGYSGPDQFTYQALDSTSPYPIHPQSATVALSVATAPAPRVVIDSAPTSVVVGHGAQLHATVANDLGSVTWSVNGVDGGGAGAGTISPSGFYTAPSKVPPAGHVTIGARSASGAHDERVVKIVLPSDPPPTPGGPNPPPGRLLGPIGAALRGSVLVAGVTPGRAGVVAIRARIGKSQKLGACRAKTPKGRRFACSVNVPWGANLKKLVLVATLTRDGKVVATRTRSGPPR